MRNISNFILVEMANDEEIKKLGWNMGNIEQLAEATNSVLLFAHIHNEYTHENYPEKVEAIAHTIAKYINTLIDNGQYSAHIGGLGFVFDKREDFVREAFYDFKRHLEIEERYIRPSGYKHETLKQSDYKNIFPEKLPIVVAKREQIIAKNKKRMKKALEQRIKEDIKETFISNDIFECDNVFIEHCVNQKRK